MAALSDTQVAIDRRNSEFWSELCGSGLARSAGIAGDEPDALERFDDLYFGFYPYLKGYVDRFDLGAKDVLEIGLGYGTLGGYLASRGARYHGLDIAPVPVSMMQHRLRLRGEERPESRVRQGSALEIPWPSATFDAVYSIGCLHHTGDLRRSVDAVHRVLVPGGVAVVMLYNRSSARQIARVDIRRAAARVRLLGRLRASELRAAYDANAAGEAAPHTDFTSRKDVDELFAAFSETEVTAENFDDIRFRSRTLLARRTVLRTPLPRLLGLDLYIVARK